MKRSIIIAGAMLTACPGDVRHCTTSSDCAAPASCIDGICALAADGGTSGGSDGAGGGMPGGGAGGGAAPNCSPACSQLTECVGSSCIARYSAIDWQVE